MATEIKMPGLSQTTDEVFLAKWLVKLGDEVKKGDPLCEVENDKSVMPLESFTTGFILKLCVSDNSTIAAGTTIAIIGSKDEIFSEVEKANYPAGDEAKGPVGKVVPAKVQKENNIDNSNANATKMVAELAAKRGLDLGKIRGTGPGGRIVFKDLERGEESGKLLKDVSTPHIIPATKEPMEKISLGNATSKNIPIPFQRQAIARNLSKSKQEIPHFYLTMEIDAGPLLGWLEKRKRNEGHKPSFYAPLAFATAKSLQQFPQLNSSYRDTEITMHSDINIGLAITSDADLFVPVLKNAGRKNLGEIERETKWLVAKAVNGKLEPGDQAEGTITLSNLGVYPVDEFCAIINPPQVAILAFGRIRKTVNVNEKNEMSIRDVFSVTGSFDHRVVYGSQAAQFLQYFKRILEEEFK